MARELPNTVSIFDYLYIDHVRIGSYLSQLSDSGVLQTLTEEDRVEEKQGRSVAVGVHAIGEMKSGFDKAEGVTRVVSRKYDSLWVNARSILDTLDELGLIHQDLANAEVGNIVRVSGQFTVTDLRIMKPLWSSILGVFAPQVELPEGLREAAAPRHERRREQRAAAKAHASASPQQKDRKTAFNEMIARFLEEMPHTVQGTIVGESGRAWFTMDPSRMSPSPEELALEQGQNISGTWHVVGVVDAIPGPPEERPEMEGMAAATGPAIDSVRSQFGRPEAAFGLTPLMVFRALKK